MTSTADELVGQMFESEVEMAYQVVVGLEHRGERLGHITAEISSPRNETSLTSIFFGQPT